MKGLTKKWIGVFLIVAMFPGVVGCDKDPETEVKITESDLTIWGVHANEKVLQGKELDYYSDIKEEADISLVMAKGEYESDQIIITPNVDISYYNVEVSDLIHETGEAKIPKDKISVYHERYIPVSVNSEKTGVPLGMYPDALVPMSAIVKYEENKIKANENQGVYITFETTTDQVIGTYTGMITLDFESYKKSVPVTVVVVDVTVSEETHSRSCFLTRWLFEHGELDTSQEKVDAYNDALIKYRLAPEYVMLERDSSDEGIERYVEKSIEYLLNPRLSCLSIPGGSNSKYGYSAVDEEVLAKYLYKYIEKSYELNFNLISKLIYYNAIIDEAILMGLSDEQIFLNARLFNQTVKKVADKVEADTSVTSPLKDEIVNSIRNLPNVCTFAYEERFADYDGDSYINTFCPLYNSMDTEEQRALYCQNEKQTEMWWYGCNNPKYPYTSYHVDIANTLPPRLLGWMQAEYNIVGNLYWAVNNYGLLEDYFATDAHRGAYGVEMEGLLFYPGGQYGLVEPIASLRLESIRDGLEEYEILYSMKEKFKELNLSSDEFISSLTANLYTGAKNTATVYDFKQARTALLEAYVALSSPANLCIMESKELNGLVISKVYAKAGYTVKNGDKELTVKEAYGDGYLYTIETSLFDSQENYLDLSCTLDGKTYTLKQYLGGKVEEITAENLVSSFKSEGTEVTAELIDSPILGEKDKVVRLSVGATAEIDGIYQMVGFIDKAFNEKINESTQKVVVTFYNPGTEDIDLSIAAKYKKSTLYSSMASCTIKPLETVSIEIPFAGNSWVTSGALEKLRIRFGDDMENPAKTVYVKNILIYNK